MSILFPPGAGHLRYLDVCQSLDQFRLLFLLFFPMTELVEVPVPPGIGLALFSDSQGVRKPSSHGLHLIFELKPFGFVYVLLGFVAMELPMTAGIEILIRGEDQGNAVSTGYTLGKKTSLYHCVVGDVLERANSTGSLLIVPSRMDSPLDVDEEGVPVASRDGLDGHFQGNVSGDWLVVSCEAVSIVLGCSPCEEGALLGQCHVEMSP